jgi:hypothetical protein
VVVVAVTIIRLAVHLGAQEAVEMVEILAILEELTLVAEVVVVVDLVAAAETVDQEW